MDRLDVALAFLVVAGFAWAWWASGGASGVRVSELSDGKPPAAVVVVGQVRWVEGRRMGLCQASACVRVTAREALDPAWRGRSVAVQGRFEGGSLWAEASGVDVLG